MTQHRASQPPVYLRQWIVVVGLIAAAVAASKLRHRLSPPEQPEPLPSPAASDYVRWYQVVRFPEVPFQGEAATSRVERIDRWFGALKEAGFHLRPFSEVVTRLERGVGIPKRTVVLVFEPAYRRTVERLLPRLRKHHSPALWVMPSPGAHGADRRFLPDHTRRELAAAPLWDAGLMLDEGRFTLEGALDERGQPRLFRWREGQGRTGLNTCRNRTELERLNANAEWTAAELVARLQADLPLDSRSGLSARCIQDRLWGVLSSARSPDPFDLVAPQDRRAASVSWTGTRGIRDLELELAVQAWTGELWVLLRSDRDAGARIRVGLSDDRIRVLEEKAGEAHAIWVDETPLDPAEGARLRLRISGNELRLLDPDGSERGCVTLHVGGSESGMVELAVDHRIRGAAMARDVSLVASPIPTAPNE